MAQKIGQYINPVLDAIKKLGGSARPAEGCAEVAKAMGLEGSHVLEETLKSGVSKFENKIAFVLFQCKRYAGTVRPSEIRDFRGAMQGRDEGGHPRRRATYRTG